MLQHISSSNLVQLPFFRAVLLACVSFCCCFKFSDNVHSLVIKVQNCSVDWDKVSSPANQHSAQMASV